MSTLYAWCFQQTMYNAKRSFPWFYGTWVTGSIPKRDAHLYIYIYIYTLNENSVTIICLALRRSAKIQLRMHCYVFFSVSPYNSLTDVVPSF